MWWNFIGRPAETATDPLEHLALAVGGHRSAKTSTNLPTASQGADVGKEIVDRKRDTVTDTIGLPLMLLATAAGLRDGTSGRR
ncbi:hypothetical protein [Kitasatospora sp. NPDC088783]|uniref:hypothetical protein n=1 Tax=Kitasatospora sp. NPDC088783 TaxID=3364077 RepID=UPI003809BD33